MTDETKDLIMNTYYMNLKCCKFSEELCRKYHCKKSDVEKAYAGFQRFFQDKSYRKCDAATMASLVVRLNSLAILAGNTTLINKRDELLVLCK